MSDKHQKRNPRKPSACSFEMLRQYRLHRDLFAKVKKQRRKQWFSFGFPCNFPEWPCCYAIYIGSELVYIGQTENLKIRMRSHASKSFPYWAELGPISIKAKLPHRFGDWLMTEVRLIRRLQPLLNVRGIASRKPDPYL